MNLTVDLILIALVVLCGLAGRKRGFVLSLFSFFGGLISYVVASLFANPLGQFLSERIFEPLLVPYLTKSLNNKLSSEAASESFLGNLAETLARFGVKEGDIEAFWYRAELGMKEAIEGAAELIATRVAASLGFVLALFLLFVLVSFLLKWIAKIFDLIAKLPLLNAANRLLGLVCGLGFGTLLASLVAIAFRIFEPVIQSSSLSFFAGFSMDNTLFCNLFSKLFAFVKLRF